MSATPSFDALIARLRSGDDDAAHQVVDRFAGLLFGLAQKHLDRRLRHRAEPDDVLQSAFKSFFWRHADGQFKLTD